MIDQTCQEAGYITARPLEGWLDDGWPGEGVFPHTVAYGSGMCILAGGFCGGAGDGGGACVHHVRDVRRRHESRSRTFMVESRRVSSRSCFEFVAGVRDLAEKFQGRGVRGSKGGECGCNELVTDSLHVCGMFVYFYAFAAPNAFWVGAREYIKRDSVVDRG